jgi:hypothetical protein
MRKTKFFMRDLSIAALVRYFLHFTKTTSICDGGFMQPGCYTGDYALSGDTIILYKIKKHDGVPSNRFIIRRYKNMDSSYWQWKYPDQKDEWESMRHSDSLRGSTGDIFPLTTNGEIVFNRDNYFLIRYDKLNNNR